MHVDAGTPVPEDRANEPRFVRPDPARDAVPGQEILYNTVQSLWSAYARRRYRADFGGVETFCLFIGYPRSGHSLVGAMLNAHRHAVVSHELDAPRLVLAGCPRDTLYSRILARAAWFNLRGNTSNYRYQIPNQWQGRFETLRVVGDKGGGWAAQWVRKQPDLLHRLRETVGVPLRLIHVVRNPFDNIAAISRWHKLSLDDSIAFYFSHCETTGNLQAVAETDEVITLHHEDLIRDPVSELSALCAFVGLNPDADYVAACGSVVFGRPTNTRTRLAWSAEQIATIDRLRSRYPFLRRYQFDIADEERVDSRDASPFTGTRAERPGGEWTSSLRERLAAFFNPHSAPLPQTRRA